MIAVTGAAGFIGSTLAGRLASMGHDLVLVDHPLTPEKTVNLRGLERFPFLDHLAFLEKLDALSPEAIFHLGACSRTTETDWDYLRRNNVEYTRTLWEWCARHGRPLYYASSAATYGDGSRGFDDHTHPDTLEPLNLYGRSKNDFDRWALARVAEAGPTPPAWAGLKFFNVFGPGEAHKTGMTSVVFNAYHEIVRTGEVRLFKSTDPAFADGGQHRDFVFVEDCIEHMLWLWRHPGAGGLFNSGTGQARTFLDLARAVFAAMGRPPRVRFIDMPEQLRGRYQNHTQAEMGKLRAAGCGVPATSLEAAVRRYVEVLSK